MDMIVEMRFGSHLYGTATPTSDLDVKAVYLPPARDILLQRVRPTVSESREKAPGERNRPEDVDRETYSLQRYLGLLAEGQTVAIDMLFAPDGAMLREPHSLWREIQGHSHRLIGRQAASFVSYCRQQANKYGIKGSRVAAARKVLDLLSEAEARLGATVKLDVLAAELDSLVAGTEHVEIADLPGPQGRLVRHIDVCGRKMPYSASIKNGREIAERLVAEYGQRALQAERSEGVDWKALSHAVRVGRQAIDLFASGRIDFPLRYADHLLAIKRGELAYPTVAAEIERLLEQVEQAVATSRLPEQPDFDLIDRIVEQAYRDRVVSEAVK
jgi:hypothetical protein